VTAAQEDKLLLFATRTCPNCRQAEILLQEAGIGYTKVLAEENAELAGKLGIRQAPTLVAGNDKMVGLGAVRRYIADHAS
jgi:ribonucleoside-triphosphate reductase